MSSSRETHAPEKFRLLTLGGLSLVAPAGSVVRQQRRRLALLALVAAAGDRGVSRDRLIAWLSPESTTDSARHSLHQLLYYLRQQAGENVFTGSDPLSLNHEIIETDLAQFESAIRSGSLEEAADLYKGPFLEGFHLNDSPEFDEWASTERARLAAVFGDALIRLANEATARGDHTKAIRWWRQLESQNPISGRAALGLMRALIASGDAPGALVHARDHEALVRSELGSGPDPELSALVEKLQSASKLTTRVSNDDPPMPATIGIIHQDTDSAAGKAATIAIPARNVGARRNTRLWITSGLFAAAAGGYLLLLSANSARIDSGTSLNRLAHSDQILVGDFDAQARDSLAARAISEVLRTSLGDSRAVSIVSRVEVDRALKLMQLPVTSRLDRQLAQDLAIRNGYEAILGGAITPLGKGYVVSARLTTPNGKELATLSESASSADGLIPAVDRLSKTLRRRIGESATSVDSVPSLPQVTTRSLRALELFTQAQDETRAGRATEPRTLALLREAIVADSTFAMAHRFLGIKLYLLESVHESIRELRYAERYSDHLTEVERLQALSTLHLVLRDYPRSVDEAQGVLRLKPRGTWALNQIGILDNLLGRHQHSMEIAHRRGALEPSGQGDAPIAALYAGSSVEALTLARRFLHRVNDSAATNTFRSARNILATVHSATFAFDSAEYYALPRSEADAGSPGIVARSQLARGQIDKAFKTWRVRERGAERNRATSGFSATREAAAAAAIVILLADRPAAARRLDAVLSDSAYRSGHAGNRSIAPVLALALAGRVADARRELAQIERASDADLRAARYPEFSLARGAVALAENRLADAIQALDHAGRSPMLSDDACRVCALPWLGRAHEAAGSPDSAVAVYERYLSTGDPSRIYADGTWYAIALRRLGELYAERGDTARAIRRLEQFAVLWKDADPELQPQVASARRRIAELRGARPLVAVSR